MGTRYLQESLNKQLAHHINDKLPAIRSALLEKQADLELQMKLLGISERQEEADETRTMMR